MLRFMFVLAIVAGLAPATQVITGDRVVDAGMTVHCQATVQEPGVDSYELLQNGGFESGSMEPWETTNWVIDSGYPHSGTYCACDVGDYSITQWVDTTPGNEIQSVMFWARQPEAPTAQAYRFFYSDGSSEGFVWVLSNSKPCVSRSHSSITYSHLR